MTDPAHSPHRQRIDNIERTDTMRLTSLALAGAAGMSALAPAVPAAAAASVTLFSFHQHEVSSEHFAAGEGACVGYAGTLVEHRDVRVRGVQHDSGGLAGQMSARETVDATFSLTPDDPADGPAYTGTYREGGTGRAIGFDQTIVSTYHLVAHATGSDGSTLRFLLRGHVTTTPRGAVHAATDSLTCIQP
ncbi:MAG: hypothetical protein QOJ60_50 [Actinomycetota bacterium]|jgi:hypothetical protein|nr:hypothetical protein [Actinomycetota bacterium]